MEFKGKAWSRTNRAAPSNLIVLLQFPRPLRTARTLWVFSQRLFPIAFGFAVATQGAELAAGPYAWLPARAGDAPDALLHRIPPPPGYRRTESDDSFAAWLRGLPLKPGRPPVYLFNKTLKANQSAHHAVIDMDVGARDLQQCADAVMRLRAEYLYSRGNWDAIRFNFTDGVPARYGLWRRGYRPRLRKGAKTLWRPAARADTSYAGFRSYLEAVYTYAGTYSLSRELEPVKTEDLRIGDVFIQGGFPGHAVLVVDLAERPGTRRKKFLLAQSFMPAQEMHVLARPDGGDPWYTLPFGETLETPEWSFKKSDLKRWP